MMGWSSCCGAACAVARAGAKQRSSEVKSQRRAGRCRGELGIFRRIASLIEEHIGRRTPSRWIE